MKPEGSGDGERIPGGKLLAQYCCRVMIAHWKSINEGAEQKLEEQRQLFRKFPPGLGNDREWCRECGVVKGIMQVYYCEYHQDTPVCYSCMRGPEEERICPSCSIWCDYDVEGSSCKKVTQEGKTCSACRNDLCTDHRQYCSHCGELFCKQDKATDCFDKHSCAQGRKRAKH